MSSERFEMRVPKDLLERVDAARGHESRASFVKRAIAAVLPPKLVTPSEPVTISDHSGQIVKNISESPRRPEVFDPQSAAMERQRAMNKAKGL
jgi:hypothetical protein